MRKRKTIIRVLLYALICYLIGAFALVYKPIAHDYGVSMPKSFPRISFNKSDRVLIISPHPDDAVLACSGVIEKAIEIGAKVKIIYVTYGTHNTSTMVKEEFVPNPVGAIELGEERHREAVKAMETLGLKQSNLVFLGFPDFGTLKIWTDYFGKKPYYSGLTMHDKVFYNTAYKIGVPFTEANELTLLENVIYSFMPTKIFFPPLSDINPDHRASGLFIKAALFDLKEKLHPDCYTYFVHAEKWPSPWGLYPNNYINPPTYIKNLKGIWKTINLSIKEEKLKKRAILMHKSQYETNPSFMQSFVRKNEIFLVPRQSRYGTFLPLWSKEIMQKAGLTSFIESVRIAVKGKYIEFTIKLSGGVPPFTKLIIFFYPEIDSTPFKNAPKYRIEIRRMVDKDINILLFNKDKVIIKTSANLYGYTNKRIFYVDINKKYLSQSKSFFSATQIEQGGVRISESPWWNVKINEESKGGLNK